MGTSRSLGRVNLGACRAGDEFCDQRISYAQATRTAPMMAQQPTFTPAPFVAADPPPPSSDMVPIDGRCPDGSTQVIGLPCATGGMPELVPYEEEGPGVSPLVVGAVVLTAGALLLFWFKRKKELSGFNGTPEEHSAEFDKLLDSAQHLSSRKLRGMDGAKYARILAYAEQELKWFSATEVQEERFTRLSDVPHTARDFE